jgi:hypothetical protein
MLCGICRGGQAAGRLHGRIFDDATGQPVAARVYVSGSNGQHHFVASPPGGRAVRYDAMDAASDIRETYTCVDTAGFLIDLPPDRYEVVVERGKEYLPHVESVNLTADRTQNLEIRIRRLFNMAKRGWYSADCHVHTRLADLPVAQLADDVNVAFPVTAWATRPDQVPSSRPPAEVPAQGRAVVLDGNHVYWDLNTEYETIPYREGHSFLLGAVLILGHQRPFDMPAPPIVPVAHEARRQGAVLDCEKHTWPWSPMLVPVAGADTMELSHNSMWRQKTISHYLWGRTPPRWVGKPPLNGEQFVHYGLEVYYAHLNCGQRIVASAGSANGVHPVPLGTSRVYCRVDGPFSYEAWMESFKAGRSFATNGPMLLFTADGREPGEQVTGGPGQDRRVRVRIEAMSTGDLDRIELVANGRVVVAYQMPRSNDRDLVHRAAHSTEITLQGSTWLVARCLERSSPDNPRFAHTSPIWFDDPARPLQPEHRQIGYLIDSVSEQIEKGRAVLPPGILAEYRQALDVYRGIAATLPSP